MSDKWIERLVVLFGAVWGIVLIAAFSAGAFILIAIGIKILKEP